MQMNWILDQQKTKVPFLSEMARNANENEYRPSKVDPGGHFGKKLKVGFLSEMARNANENEFWMNKKIKFAFLTCKRKWISNIQNGQNDNFAKKLKLHFYRKW